MAEMKQQFVEPYTPPPPPKSAINRRMSRVSLMAAQSIPTIQATVQGKSRTSHLTLLDCELLSEDYHLDALGKRGFNYCRSILMCLAAIPGATKQGLISVQD